MNEEKTVMNGDKPRKKKRSLWWLWFLLILAAFAGGCVAGLKINTLPLPTEIRDRLYPVLESYIPGSTTPRTPNAVAVTPEPTAEPVAAPVPAEETPAPEAAPIPAAETLTPSEESPIPAEETPAPAAETPAPVAEIQAPAPAETAEVFRMSDTDVFESAEPAKKYIGVEAALEIALKHAEIEEADAEISGVYRTKEADGEAVYEVSFTSGDISYEYVIDAFDGEIAGWKMSGFTFSDTAAYAADFTGNDLPEAEVAAAPASAAVIGEENAKEIAFNHAAVKQAEVLRATVEMSSGPDGDFYAVEFRTASRQFSYKIDAHTGEILADKVTK